MTTPRDSASIISEPQRSLTASPSTPSSPVSFFLLFAAGLLIPALLTYGLVAANEIRTIAVIGAILSLAVIIAKPFWGLVFFFILVFVRPEENIAAIQGMRLPLLISLATFFAAWIQFSLRRTQLVRTPTSGMLLGFACIAVLSTAPTGVISNSVDAIQDIAKLVILVFLIFNLVKTPQEYRLLVTVSILSITYLALYATYLFFNGVALVEHEGVRSQATGIFSNPNDLAGTIVIGFALVFSRFLSGRGFRRVFYLLLMAVLVWTILVTQSRGGMMALMVVGFGGMITFVRNKPMAIALALTTGVLLFSLGSHRMTNYNAGEDSANSRLGFWEIGLQVTLQHPLIGVGYRQLGEYIGRPSHNSFMTCLGDTGFLGFFCWMGCIFYAFKKMPGDEALELSVRKDIHAARLGLLGYLVGSFFSNHTYILTMYVMFALPVAARIAAQSSTGIAVLSKEERYKDWGRIGLLSLGMIGLIYGMVWKFR